MGTVVVAAVLRDGRQTTGGASGGTTGASGGTTGGASGGGTGGFRFLGVFWVPVVAGARKMGSHDPQATAKVQCAKQKYRLNNNTNTAGPTNNNNTRRPHVPTPTPSTYLRNKLVSK
jgi:hypothetical protein